MNPPTDVPLINRVSHVHKVDPDYIDRGRSPEVNDYLMMGSWILLNTGIDTAESDSGPRSRVHYIVGWIGEGAPEFPPAGPG